MLRPSTIVITVALLVAAGLPSTPAYAADGFTDAVYYSGGGGGASGPEPCSNVDASVRTPLRPLVQNAPALSGSSKTAGTLVRNSDFSDLIDYDTSVSSTARYVGGPGEPATLSLTATGSVAVTTAKPTAACRLDSEAFMEVAYSLTITAPSLIDARVRTTGVGGRGTFSVHAPGAPNGLGLSITGGSATAASTGRVLLTPGEYEGYLSVFSRYVGSVAATSSSTIDVQAVLRAVGERIGKPAGKGARYVTLPTGRTCADGKVAAAVTAKRKRADAITKIELFVDDQRVKKLTEPKKGKTVRLRAPLAQDISVRAEVTLDNGKVKVVGADYVACAV